MVYTVGSIANNAAKYLGQSRATLVDANSDDLVIAAMNGARIAAQQLRDFGMTSCQAWVSVDPNLGADVWGGAKLFTPPNTFSTTPVYPITIESVFLQDTSLAPNWWPLELVSKRKLVIKAQERNYLYRGLPYPYINFIDVPLARYPDDTRNMWPARPYRAYWQGPRMFIDPVMSAAKTLMMDVNYRLPWFLKNTNVGVTTSSTASHNVTLTATAPADLVVGSFLLGQLVTSVSGTAVVLAGNANQTISVNTSIPYSNVGPDPQFPASYFTNNEDYTDWFIEKGRSYLLYYTIDECNMFSTKFVQRAAGYLESPKKAIDLAWTRLIEWDNFNVRTNTFLTN